jgi:hypothetical protein
LAVGRGGDKNPLMGQLVVLHGLFFLGVLAGYVK